MKNKILTFEDDFKFDGLETCENKISIQAFKGSIRFESSEESGHSISVFLSVESSRELLKELVNLYLSSDE